MLTPQEVSEKVFPKSSGFGNGYAMAQVDEFLDTLTEDYTALYKENVTLKAKLKILAEKVEEYRATEDAMRSTLLTAQKMAAKLVQEAQTEKENLLKEAKEQHAAQLAQLEQDKQDAEEKLVMAKQSLAEFVRHGSELCAQQQEFLNSLPEMELPHQETAPAGEVKEIQQDIMQHLDDVLHTEPETASAGDAHFRRLQAESGRAEVWPQLHRRIRQKKRPTAAFLPKRREIHEPETHHRLAVRL